MKTRTLRPNSVPRQSTSRSSRQRRGHPGSPGFVAAVVVEEETGALFAIRLFDDQASLVGATPTADGWLAQQAGIVQSSAIELATGEVVAQKGL